MQYYSTIMLRGDHGLQRMSGQPYRANVPDHKETMNNLDSSPSNHFRGAPCLSPNQSLYTKTSGGTAIGLIGFVLSLSPLACSLMGWRVSGALGAAVIGVYFFIGGLLMILAAILEWVMGKGFNFVVFATYGGFWLSYASTLVPACAYYSPQSQNNEAAGGFQAFFCFLLLFMGLISLLFAICAVRTNIVFIILFSGVTLTFLFWSVAEVVEDLTENARRCAVGAGASAFVSLVAGWYLLASFTLETVDFPIVLPTGDLSTLIKGRNSQTQKKV